LFIWLFDVQWLIIGQSTYLFERADGFLFLRSYFLNQLEYIKIDIAGQQPKNEPKNELIEFGNIVEWLSYWLRNNYNFSSLKE